MITNRSSFIKIGTIAGFVLLLGVLMVQGESVGTTFATGQGQGGLEMKIDSHVVYNGVFQPSLSWDLKNLIPGVDKFFNFDDVKPGDTGTSTISIHIKKNPAYVCLDFKNLKDRENGENEPESLVDTEPGGELSRGLEFFAWFDDGDNHFEVGEEPLFGTSSQSAVQVLKNKTYPLADASNGPAFAKNSTHYVGVAWCAGDLTVDLATAGVSCDGEMLGNAAQTDSMSVDIRLRAVPAVQQKNFMCVPPHKPPKPCKDERGNNGHGNDNDHNDDSNPGHSNDEDDDTDDDGYPSGQSARQGGGHWPCESDTDDHDDGYPWYGHPGTVWHHPVSQPGTWSKFKKWRSTFNSRFARA